MQGSDGVHRLPGRRLATPGGRAGRRPRHSTADRAWAMSMGLAGEADALSVFLKRHAPVFDVEGRDLDGMVEVLEISRAACALS
jgi:hypothetical protein